MSSTILSVKVPFKFTNDIHSTNTHTHTIKLFKISKIILLGRIINLNKGISVIKMKIHLKNLLSEKITTLITCKDIRC